MEKYELVELSCNNLMKAEAITTSLQVAEVFGKEHKNVLSDIRETIKKIKNVEGKGQLKFKQSSYVNLQNKEQPMYKMNFSAFTLLTMGYTTEKAMKFKLAYIEEFNRMRNELLRTKQFREIGISQRKSLTSAISRNLDTGTNKYLYAEVTNLCYKKIFGKTANQLKNFYGVKTYDGLRDYLRADKLDEVDKLEARVALWLEDFGLSFEQIKEKINRLN